MTKYPIKSVKLKEAGKSTLSGKKLWYDDQFGRLNTENKGQLLGTFDPEDKVIVFYSDGFYEITDQELTQKFEPEKVVLIQKFDPEKIVSAVYLDKKNLQFNVKRFKIETTTLRNKFLFIKEGEGNYLEAVTTHPEPVLAVQQGRGAQVRKGKFKIEKVAEVMGWRTVGTKLIDYSKSIQMEWVAPKGEGNQQDRKSTRLNSSH